MANLTKPTAMRTFIIMILMFLSLKLYSQVDTLLISTYYPDKSTLFETFMINKKDSFKNGSYERFNSKGKPYIKGFYKNNIRSGIWEFYNKYSGYIELIEKYDYTNNREIFYRDKNNSQAHFIGGEEFLSDFIYSNKSLDSIKNLNGKILVGFTIDTLGSLKDIKVLRGLHPDIDKLAVKIMKGSPKWIPSIKNGMKIDETLILPIEIKK